MSRVDSRILPPSIADARSVAFVETMRQALDEPDFKRVLFERIDAVSDDVLPFLVREFSIEEFVEPGMTATTIRRLLKGSYELHATKGFIHGVRLGLELLGLRVIGWEQWFQAAPQRAPGTHRVILAMSEEVFTAEGHAITARMTGAVQRMIGGMKRWSQEIIPVFGTQVSTPVHVGMVQITRLRVRPLIPPVTQMAAQASIFMGMAVRTRLRIRPGVL